MARVVQQRTSPPYLLIVMVFLFLIAATLAVLSYMKSSDLGKQSAKSSGTLMKVADSQDLRDSKIQQMMGRYDKPPAGEQARTVVKQFQTWLNDMTESVAGQAKDPETVIGEVKATLKKTGLQRGLLVEFVDLHSMAEGLKQQSKEKEKLLADKQEQIKDKDRTIAAITSGFQSKFAELQSQIQSMDSDLKDRHASYMGDLDRARKDWEKLRDDLNTNISGKTRVIQELQQKNMSLERRVEELLTQIRVLSQPKAGAIQVGLKPDGKILQVSGQGGVCYINLGVKDRVSAGLTFSIYPPTGIPADGEGKGTIIVSNVGATTSECRIQQQTPDDPIVVGDLVANLAFDPTRKYTFVVEGEFDLYGSGRTTREGAQHAAMLVERYGGKVATEVGVDTDFIILGSEPSPPSKPGENDPSVVWQNYRELLKVYDRYNDVKTLAKSMHIPVLNTNKFLAFIGYTPTSVD